MNKTPIASRAVFLALAAMVTFSILTGIDTLAHQPFDPDALLAAAVGASAA